MGYFRCLHGAADHLVFDEPDCFAVRDDRNRAWLCHPVTREQLKLYAAHDEAPEIVAVHEGLMRLGFEASTSTCVLYCPNRDQLPGRLADCP